jgi:ferredoxin
VRIVKDESRCVAFGNCASIAPEVFRVERGEMTVLVPEPDERLRQQLEDAVAQCPAEALSIADHADTEGAR